MWKRLNNQKGARPPVVEVPRGGYVEDEFVAPAGGNRVVSPMEGSRPPRPLREVPRLQFQPASPPAVQQPDPRFRPASSVYSQPTPNDPTSKFPRTSYSNQYEQTEEVSPPSSPEYGISRSHNLHDDDVSPIDADPHDSRFTMGDKQENRPGSSSKPPSSNIPVMRREKRRNQVAAAAQNLMTRKQVGDGSRGRTAVDPRWDPYSGEITTSDKGKPQSVKPGQFTPPTLRSTSRTIPTVPSTLGGETSISGGSPKANASFGERVRKLKTHNPPAERPEWKGATGRTTLVSPVADQLSIPPLSIPRKSSKRVSSPTSSSAPVSIVRSSDTETGPATVSLKSPDSIDSTIRTVQNSGHNTPRTAAAPTALPSNSSQVRGNLPTEVHSHQKKDSAGTIERNFREAFKDVSFHPAPDAAEPYIQPPSRFSVTTYAPSEAHSTPRPSTDTSDRPPMPTPPQIQTNTVPNITPIVNRKRPKVIESPKIDSPKATMRKPINNSPPVFISMSNNPTNKRGSNISKTLPQSPAEAQSLDLISALQAQLDNLAHRRNNITRSIRQMTELMPADNVTAAPEVQRKREMEKLKVEGLREEEADVRQQEHELGLKLHRAYKRKDKEAVYEPTGLWVRRITS